jgi:RIO kinase 1
VPKHSQYLNDRSDDFSDVADLSELSDLSDVDDVDEFEDDGAHVLGAFDDDFDEADDPDDYDGYGDYEGGSNSRPERMRRRVSDINPGRKGRLTLEEKGRLAIQREDADMPPPEGDRWSNWVDAQHGPEPRPEWVLTENGACDHELGVLKTGKEADVFLLRRVLPETGAEAVMAAKRYRSNEHRQFHRDAGYLEGRRLRRTRDQRAIENRTGFGSNLIAQQWAIAEFTFLSELWQDGVPVPYPVQLFGTELLMEFLAEPDGSAAPRLAQLKPEPDQLEDLWEQLVSALLVLAGRGQTHGDLSPFNILVHQGRLVLIDLPQVVDVVINPNGREFLARDVHNVARWFAARGLPEHIVDEDALLATLSHYARLE